MADRFITLSDVLINRDKIAYVIADHENHRKVSVRFTGEVENLIVEGDEAIELWRLLATDRHYTDE
jgi:hypothetical protein